MVIFACRSGKARYENGGMYKGEFRHEQRCGWGHHTFPTGDHYEGEWLADKIHGQSSYASSQQAYTFLVREQGSIEVSAT